MPEPVTIYVPHGNSVEKNRAMRAFGGDLVEHGADFQTAREEAGRRAATDGLEFVPAFHPDLVLGVATYALELFRKAPDLDILYVPIGQGSGIQQPLAIAIIAGLLLQYPLVLLAMPVLILPSVQVNMRAGHLPQPEANGIRYLKIPLNAA